MPSNDRRRNSIQGAVVWTNASLWVLIHHPKLGCELESDSVSSTEVITTRLLAPSDQLSNDRCCLGNKLSFVVGERKCVKQEEVRGKVT